METEKLLREANPLVSVIVPVHNGESTLRNCLEAILRSDYPRYQVIVVDDASSDSSVSIAEEFPCAIVRNGHKGGAADARNAGARVSRGEILFFTDCDVTIRPGTITRLVGELQSDRRCAAAFGSYAAETQPTNFFSVYKNLVHHFTHQSAREEAASFWAGCGVIRSAAFFQVGGFDPADTSSADVEDIALGYRLAREGHRIRLAKDVQVTHFKHYSFVGLLRSDIFHRAVPWTRLMVRQRVWRNDLNTRWDNLLSTLLALAILASPFLDILSGVHLLLLLPVLISAFAYLNRRLFRLFYARKGAFFLLKAIATTVLFYIYCIVGSALGVLSLLLERRPQSTRADVLGEAVWRSGARPGE